MGKCFCVAGGIDIARATSTCGEPIVIVQKVHDD